MYKPLTIKDIAKALNLSTSTISRALRGSHEISEETKDLVLEYVNKVNYQRDPIALSLKERRSYSIGVIVCEVANQFYSQIINGIESVAYNKGYHVIISQTHDRYEREVINVEHLANRSIDGLIVSVSAEDKDYSHFEKLHQRGLPIVFFDRVLNSINTHKVLCNNFKGAFEATKFLIAQGCKRIAHLTNAPQLSITIERQNGYEEALKSHGIPVDPSLIKYCRQGGGDQMEVEEAVEQLLSSPQAPDAVFVASDRLSIGCLLAFKKHNVLENVLIAGFSSSEAVELFKPSFSYVAQPAYDMGCKAAELLISLIESRYPIEDFETVTFDTTFYPSLKKASNKCS